ncbi:hypothetical protein BDR26DRAFT_864772 [Obelidium mucronatum]|nr:hypothetical protein BDR26DRAFT_864772 [Obelidium mucronatum]
MSFSPTLVGIPTPIGCFPPSPSAVTVSDPSFITTPNFQQCFNLCGLQNQFFIHFNPQAPSCQCDYIGPSLQSILPNNQCSIFTPDSLSSFVYGPFFSFGCVAAKELPPDLLIASQSVSGAVINTPATCVQACLLQFNTEYALYADLPQRSRSLLSQNGNSSNGSCLCSLVLPTLDDTTPDRDRICDVECNSSSMSKGAGAGGAGAGGGDSGGLLCGGRTNGAYNLYVGLMALATVLSAPAPPPIPTETESLAAMSASTSPSLQWAPFRLDVTSITPTTTITIINTALSAPVIETGGVSESPGSRPTAGPAPSVISTGSGDGDSGGGNRGGKTSVGPAGNWNSVPHIVPGPNGNTNSGSNEPTISNPPQTSFFSGSPLFYAVVGSVAVVVVAALVATRYRKRKQQVAGSSNDELIVEERFHGGGAVGGGVVGGTNGGAPMSNLQKPETTMMAVERQYQNYHRPVSFSAVTNQLEFSKSGGEDAATSGTSFPKLWYFGAGGHHHHHFHPTIYPTSHPQPIVSSVSSKTSVLGVMPASLRDGVSLDLDAATVEYNTLMGLQGTKTNPQPKRARFERVNAMPQQQQGIFDEAVDRGTLIIGALRNESGNSNSGVGGGGNGNNINSPTESESTTSATGSSLNSFANEEKSRAESSLYMSIIVENGDGDLLQ